jgi:putative membrane protein
VADGKILNGTQLPGWVCGFLSGEDVKAIEQAVHKAEIKTSAEIVPMVVRSSVSLEWLPFYSSALIALVIVAMGAMHFLELHLPISTWILDLHLESVIYLAVILIVSSFASALFLRSRLWVRALIPDSLEHKAVMERAVREFYSSRIQHTQSRTGVLIFFSILERKAVVLTDEIIAQKIPNSNWDELIADVIKAKKAGRLGEGLVTKIAQCAEVLAPHFPRAVDDKNELSNLLIIKE